MSEYQYYGFAVIDRLVKLGVLSEMTGYARNRRFRYAPYINLFD